MNGRIVYNTFTHINLPNRVGPVYGPFHQDRIIACDEVVHVRWHLYNTEETCCSGYGGYVHGGRLRAERVNLDEFGSVEKCDQDISGATDSEILEPRSVRKSVDIMC